MKIKMKNLTPAIVLGVICLVVAALLATINHFTAPIIKENELYAKTASLREVFGGDESGAEFGDAMKNLPDLGEGSYVTEVYEEKNGKGYAVVLVIPRGYEGEIDLTVGVDTDGKVTGVVITKYNDSIGKDKMPDAVKSFVGKDSADGVELVTGATFSSNAVRDAVNQALGAVKAIKAQSTAQISLMSEEVGAKASNFAPILTEEDYLAKAKTMLEGAEGFEFVKDVDSGMVLETKADYRAYKLKVYKETSGRGFAIYGETFNEWTYLYGLIESSFVFVTDEDFKITDFEITGWSLSTSYQEEVKIYLDNPAVKRLEESFIGANLMNFSTRVDLVSSATETSVRMKAAVTAALGYLDENHSKDIKMYKALGATAFFAAIAAFGVAIYFQRRRRV